MCVCVCVMLLLSVHIETRGADVGFFPLSFSTIFKKNIHFILNYTCVCDFMWVCAHEGRCLQTPVMSAHLKQSGVTGGCEPPDVGGGKPAQGCAKAV